MEVKISGSSKAALIRVCEKVLTHANIDTVFLGAEVPEEPQFFSKPHSKQVRLKNAIHWADESSSLAGLLESLLRVVSDASDSFNFANRETADLFDKLRAALLQDGVSVDGSGKISLTSNVPLEPTGLGVLDAQLERIARNRRDADLQVGTARELLESISKIALEMRGDALDACPDDFPKLIKEALLSLGLHSSQFEGNEPVGKIMGSAQNIAVKINELRNAHGTGHGRSEVGSINHVVASYVVSQAYLLVRMMRGQIRVIHGV